MCAGYVTQHHAVVKAQDILIDSMPALVLANGCRVRCYCRCLQALYSHNLAVNANGDKVLLTAVAMVLRVALDWTPNTNHAGDILKGSPALLWSESPNKQACCRLLCSQGQRLLSGGQPVCSDPESAP